MISGLAVDTLMNNKNRFAPDRLIPLDQGEIAGWMTRPDITLEFDAIARHIDFVNQSIVQEMEDIKAAALEYVQELGLDDQDEEGAHYEHHRYLDDRNFHFLSAFPQIQWRAEFLLVYSFFEHTLNQLCLHVQKRSNFELSYKDSKGNGICRARNYLIKVAGVKDTFIAPTNWERARLLGDIRNAITHKNGEIEYTPDNAKSLCARMIKAKMINESLIQLKRDIPPQKDAEIVLSYEFVKQSISEFQVVVMEVCNYRLYADKS